MKYTKRLLAAVMAFAMVSAIAPMSAFADTEVKRDSSNQSGEMKATYDVTAKYTVTIPAGVTLDSENSVTANFKASEVMLGSGQKIKVTLNSADHTESGSTTFHAQTEKGDSTATYTIGKGDATTGVKVGDTVAEFTENGTQSITFSKAEGATYAGTHTETLTFGIAVVTTRTVTWNNDDITGSGNSFSKDGVTITAGSIDFDEKNFEENGTFTTTLGNFTKIEVVATKGFCDVSGTGWSGDSDKRTWTGNASSVSFIGDIYGDGNGIKFVFTIEP